MKALVLSGGGNLGATQVGALSAMIERNIIPEMIVGCSAGALNAAFLAREVSAQHVEELAEIWRAITRDVIYPGTRLGAFWRFVTGKDSLYDNRPFFDFLQRGGITPAVIFAHYLPIRLYITATRISAGELHVFGDNPSDRLIDALMASTALPPMHPPWEVAGELYTDGGTITPLPLRVALERGATEIYALHVVSSDTIRNPEAIRGVTTVATTSINTMLRLQAEHDLLLAEVARRVKLHYIPLTIEESPDALDFDKADRLMELGMVAAERYFDSIGLSRPDRATSWWQRLAEWRRQSDEIDESASSPTKASVGGLDASSESVNAPN